MPSQQQVSSSLSWPIGARSTRLTWEKLGSHEFFEGIAHTLAEVCLQLFTSNDNVYYFSSLLEFVWLIFQFKVYLEIFLHMMVEGFWVFSFKVHRYILRRPQNFAKSSPYFWLHYILSKAWGRFRKILWPSQNIWTLLVQSYWIMFLDPWKRNEWTEGCARTFTFLVKTRRRFSFFLLFWNSFFLLSTELLLEQKVFW